MIQVRYFEHKNAHKCHNLQSSFQKFYVKKNFSFTKHQSHNELSLHDMLIKKND